MRADHAGSIILGKTLDVVRSPRTYPLRMREMMKRTWTLILTLWMALLAACSESQGSAGAAPPPPTAVSYIVVAPRAIPVVSDLPGRIAPTQIAIVCGTSDGYAEVIAATPDDIDTATVRM